MRLLLVEDDTMIGESVLDLLRAEHYAVDWVKDGELADTALCTQDYDLLLLDLGLPRRDGLSVLRALRARKNRLPVLIATARDSVQQRIEGLDAGADDYVLKPYDLDELLARIRALLRRAATVPAKGRLEFHDITLDLAAEHDANFATIRSGVPQGKSLEGLTRWSDWVALRSELETALQELVGAGLVNADSFAGLRALTTPASKRQAHSSRRGRGAFVGGMDDAGRWALLRRPATPAEDTLEQLAFTLLRRYGVVCWRLLEREADWLPSWRELLLISAGMSPPLMRSAQPVRRTRGWAICRLSHQTKRPASPANSRANCISCRRWVASAWRDCSSPWRILSSVSSVSCSPRAVICSTRSF